MNKTSSNSTHLVAHQRQSGYIFIVILVVLVIGSSTYFGSFVQNFKAEYAQQQLKARYADLYEVKRRCPSSVLAQ